MPSPTLIILLVLGALFLTNCSREQSTVEARLSRAQDYLAHAEYDKAEGELLRLLRLAPSNFEAVRQLGFMYYDEGRYSLALLSLKKLADLEPQNLDVQIKVGQIFLSARRHQEARDKALLILRQQPGHEEALLLLASAGIASKVLDETKILIEGLRNQDQDKDRIGYHLALGNLALIENDSLAAERDFKTAFDENPQSSAVHLALGTLYWRQKKLDDADREFKAAADLAPLRSPKRIRYAEFKLLTGAPARARTIAEELIERAPDYLPPRVLLLKVECAQAQSQKCGSLAQAVLDKDPFNYDALLQVGTISLANHDRSRAIEQFERMTALFPRNPIIRHRLALAYLLDAKDLGAVDKSIENLNVALSLDPHYDQATLLLAELRLRKDQPTVAIDLLTKLIVVRPLIPQAHLLLATAFLRQHNTDEALKVYRKMAEVFLQNPKPLFLTGLIFLDGNRLLDAHKAFDESLNASPDFWPALEKLVDLDISGGDFDAGLNRLQKTLDKYPAQPQPYLLRAKLYFTRREIRFAEADLLKSIELDPDLKPAVEFLARLYAESHRPELAVETLGAFTEKHPDVAALLEMAKLYEQLGQFDASVRAYERLLAINDRFVPALNNLAVLYSERFDRLESAYELALKASRYAPEDAHISDTLGWILFKKGDYRAAVRLLSESVNKLDDQTNILLHLGLTYYMLGQEDDARRTLEKVVADGSIEQTLEAKRHLEILDIDPNTKDQAIITKLESYLRDHPRDVIALTKFGVRNGSRNGGR
jgi:tetratricopeptide (TPR) repeat protein